ncbi:hypothetical protein DN069_21050 [Streptacidiphilus pinicola]|uniref:Sensor domain-containing protein n=1 Tax=Streptacidiphilus pinicola TaxID=2219663 RepID=A0A2X0IGH8_9ACTN|nr:hypothetical protein [Streptacidiphilus pinicola]RAG83647.1 hypothetical protein DN069_21050 [Streptacidiphilus pinicola]
MTTHPRRALAAALCAGTALALTACSSPGGTTVNAGSTSSAVASPSPSSAPADPNAGLPNGIQLSGWLLPASVVPKLKSDRKAVVNSGEGLAQPSDKAVAKTEACDQLGRTDWMEAGGVGPSAAAGNDFADPAGNEFYQQLNAYQGTRAAQEFAALKKVFTECRSFPAKVSGGTYTMRVKLNALPGLGDEAVKAVLTSPDIQGGETLVAIRSGRLLVTTMYNDQSKTGAQALTLAQRLLKNVPPAPAAAS